MPPRIMIATNDPFEAANDNPPHPKVNVRWCHIQIVGEPAQLVVDIDCSELMEWIRQRGCDA